MNDPSFSFYDFKKWIDKHPCDIEASKIQDKEIVGRKVESRIGIKRLNHQIDQDNPELDAISLSEHFKSHGGLIIDEAGKLFLIETDLGQFHIPKVYVKYSEV